MTTIRGRTSEPARDDLQAGRSDDGALRAAGPAQDPVRAMALAVGYEGRTVVGDINLTVGPQSSLALVGTNGSGKSTLLKTIIGLIPVIAGTLQVLGAEPGATPTRGAYLSQFHASGFVLPLRALDVVRMARYPALGHFGRMRSEDHDLVESAMRTMGVLDLARTPLGALSGGQRQRVYLAQVLARRADLILLDEPTAGLDAGGREVYLTAFGGELARGASLVTATHDIAEAVEYDQVLLLAGRVVALGPGRQVLSADQLLETFGILVRDEHLEHAGRFVVAERTHGHPQAIDVGTEVAGRPSAPPPSEHHDAADPGNTPGGASRA